MPLLVMCPYWKYELGLKPDRCLPEKEEAQTGYRTVCEGGTLEYTDRYARRDYVYRYCAHPTGWKGCTVAQNLEKQYERKAVCGELCVTKKARP